MYDPTVAATVLGMSGYQLLSAWNTNAPSLSDLRSVSAGDMSAAQKLQDADFLVGGLAVVMGIGYFVLTRKWTALILLSIMFGMVSGWHHAVLNADER